MNKAKEEYNKNRRNPDLEIYADNYIKELKQKTKWISVEDRLPENETKVIAFFVNSYKKNRTITAQYIHKRSIKAEDFLDIDVSEDWFDYDEEKDIYWTPEGWYEFQEMSDINYYIDDEITHWMPLPEPPEVNK